MPLGDIYDQVSELRDAAERALERESARRLYNIVDGSLVSIDTGDSDAILISNTIDNSWSYSIPIWATNSYEQEYITCYDESCWGSKGTKKPKRISDDFKSLSIEVSVRIK